MSHRGSLITCVTEVLDEYRGHTKNRNARNESSRSIAPQVALTPTGRHSATPPRTPQVHDDDSRLCATPLHIAASPTNTQDASPASHIFEPSDRNGLMRMTHGAQCLLQSYSSTLLANKPQLFLLVLANKSLPANRFLGVLGTTLLTFYRTGRTLIATVPPQTPGELTFMLTSAFDDTTHSVPNELMIQFILTHAAHNPCVDHLPVTIVEPPPTATSQPCGPQTRSAVQHHNTHPPSRGATLAKTARHASRSVAKGVTPNSIWKRLNHLESDTVTNNRNSESRIMKELQLALASLDPSLINTAIPFTVRAPIFHSVPHMNRKFIAINHCQIFQLQPFQIYSASLFTKTKPREPYTIFSFTLRCKRFFEKEKNNTSETTQQNQLPTTHSYIASLERFEATDRMCCDPRYWRLVDEAVPCANAAAAKLCDAPLDLRASPPLPLRGTKPSCSGWVKQNDAAVQLAKGVFLHWEAWPQNVLPCQLPDMLLTLPQHPSPINDHASRHFKLAPHNHAPTPDVHDRPHHVASRNERHPKCRPQHTSPKPSNSTPNDDHDTTSPSQRGDQQLSPHQKSPTRENHTPPDSDEQPPDGDCRHETPTTAGEPLSMAVTLCVGDYVYTSVTGVSQDLLKFILRTWLLYVPKQKPSVFAPQRTHLSSINVPYSSLAKNSSKVD